MSVNKLLTFIIHNRDRRKKTTHRWTNQISEYDSVSLHTCWYDFLISTL